jgi:hypothetical protein
MDKFPESTDLYNELGAVHRATRVSNLQHKHHYIVDEKTETSTTRCVFNFPD